MLDKEQVISEIKRQEQKLKELPDLGHARLLLACKNGCLFNELKHYKYPYRHGKFEFSVEGHSTGIDYKISVVAPDDTTLTVRHINYSYGHKSTEHVVLWGAWDYPLDKVLEDFRELQKKFILDKIEELVKLREVFINEEKALKAKFEAVFK